MLIENWMKRKVHTVKPRDSIRHARKLMEERRINQLPVVASGQLVGIVTDRDLRDAFPSVLEHHRRRLGADANPDTVPVEDLMSRNVLMLGPQDTLEEAAALMRRERIGAVPIVDGHRLVGIVARSDVLEAFGALAQLLHERSVERTL